MNPFDLEESPFPPIDPPGITAAESVAAVNETHAECLGVIDAMTGPIRAAVRDCLGQCQTASGDCLTCIEGPTLRALDQAGAVADKCKDRILAYVISLMQEAYGRAEPVIGAPPPTDQVIADLTGVAPPPAGAGQGAGPSIPPPAPPVSLPPAEDVIREIMAGRANPPVNALPDCTLEPGQVGSANVVPYVDPVSGQYVCPAGMIAVNSDILGPLCVFPDQCSTFAGPGDVKPGPIIPPAPAPPPPGPIVPPPAGSGDVCPADPEDKPEPCPAGGGHGPQVELPDFGNPAVCSWLEKYQSGNHQDAGHLAVFLGLRDQATGKPTFPAWMQYGIAGGLPFLKPVMAQLGAWGCDAAEYLVKQLPAPASCNAPAALVPRLISIALGAAERWIGDGFGPLQTTLEYWSNYHCPTQIPSADAAIDLYNREYIDIDQYNCLVRANGVHPYWHRMQAEMARGSVSALEFVELNRRGVIDKLRAQQRIKQTTGMPLDEIDQLWRLTDYVPGPGDLISFMQRDVFDQSIIEQYGLDDEFADKFRGDAVRWAQAQGMTADQFKYYWRAHWDWPSPTQLYTMLHRLYKGSPVLKDGVEPVTEADVEKVLGVNDTIPVWRKRLVAISYNPMTRVDTRRAFCMGVLNDDQVYHNLRAIGYDDRTAKIMTDYYKVEKEKGCLSEPQYITWKQVIGYYVNGLSSYAETVDELDRLGVSRKKIDRYMEQAVFARTIKRRGILVKAVKRAFGLGDIDRSSAVARLIGLGIAPDHAADTVATWSDAKRAQGKTASAAELCKWYDRGLLDENEYRIRLIQAGWPRADAERIVSVCQDDSDAKRAAAAERKAEKERKAQEKAQKEREKRDKASNGKK